MVPHHLANAGEVRDFRVAKLVCHQGGGDVDAVQDVADIVEYACRYLGHARLSGGLEKLTVELFPFPYFKPQCFGALVDPFLEIVTSRLKVCVSSLYLAQHVVKSVNEPAKFVVPAFSRAKPIVPFRGYSIGD